RRTASRPGPNPAGRDGPPTIFGFPFRVSHGQRPPARPSRRDRRRLGPQHTVGQRTSVRADRNSRRRGPPADRPLDRGGGVRTEPDSTRRTGPGGHTTFGGKTGGEGPAEGLGSDRHFGDA